MCVFKFYMLEDQTVELVAVAKLNPCTVAPSCGQTMKLCPQPWVRGNK